MSFDGIVTRAVVCELSEKLTDGRIDKIYQPERDEIILSIRTHTGVYRLLMSASSSNPRLHLTSQKRENPVVAPLFCMILRKHLQGGKILSIKQINSDRIVEFAIESYTELGDLTTKRLIIEIMGRHSNIILVSEKNTIIDSVKHIDFTVSSIRQILPGLIFEYPPVQNKISPNDITRENFINLFNTSKNDCTFEKLIVDTVTGMSPLLAREISYRAFGKFNVPVLNADYDKILSCLDTFFLSVKQNNYTPVVAYDEKCRHPQAFSCFELTQYEPLPQIKSGSISEAIDKFYEERSQNERIFQKSAVISKILSNNTDRCKKKIQLHKTNLKKSQDREKYKIYGDLLTANIYSLKSGEKSANVINYYSENQELIEIQLKPELSPSANAQRYYKLFNKAKSTEKHSREELTRAENELYYLESVSEALSLAKTPADIDEIKEELSEQGYLKTNKKKDKKKQTKASPLKFVTSDGYTVFVGRNNKENDFLTLKSSYSTDIWLHTKIIPGSHTVIKTNGSSEATETAIYEAAVLAAYHSKAKNSAQVPVDYTNIKNVKKPSGAKPGLVIYDNYNTIYVKPDENLVEALRNN